MCRRKPMGPIFDGMITISFSVVDHDRRSRASPKRVYDRSVVLVGGGEAVTENNGRSNRPGNR
jgi:hypothetical protein